MPSIRVPAFAKVNLRLDVLGRRADGYHELRTIFQSLSLHDTLHLERTRKPGIELEIAGDSSLAAAATRENLVWRAADALRRDLKFSAGVRIRLEKRVPVGRGLGGGSSDAAAALAGLLRLTGRQIARNGCWRSPQASARTCPSSCSAGEPWERIEATKSTRFRTAPQTLLVVSPAGDRREHARRLWLARSQIDKGFPRL